ncbi:sugar transferase [Chitinimonas taiwanensis]|uniref:sugar transferase n=1 Tax=Chitinimonas taiwanensis TaxID=240412 RepID=UPI000931BA94|nr:sugar transferase [Chitinimonas taiwanensis]
MKRVFDVLCSALAMFLLLPILVLAAIFIWLQDGGPVFFSQLRVGKKGRLFRMWKFRSMVLNAESLGGYSTQDNDPRITPVGRFIRRTSIDELPQLFNVLCGDMSVVGPRPDVPAQRELYSDVDWAVRHQVRPGITGLAQATLRSEATTEQRKALDLEYARNASIRLDVKIILMTFKQVVFKGGN